MKSKTWILIALSVLFATLALPDEAADYTLQRHVFRAAQSINTLDVTLSRKSVMFRVSQPLFSKGCEREVS